MWEREAAGGREGGRESERERQIIVKRLMCLEACAMQESVLECLMCAIFADCRICAKFARHLQVLTLWGTGDKVVTREGHQMLVDKCGLSTTSNQK